MTQVTCNWFKTPMSKLMCCFGIGLVPLTELQVTFWHFSMAWTAAVSCCRTAWICKDQIPWQTLALKHWLLEYMVDLPVGKRRCSFLCPLLGTRAEDPSFTCAQCDNCEGVSWRWMLPAPGQQLLFHLAFLWHPTWTPSTELAEVLQADEPFCC